MTATRARPARRGASYCSRSSRWRSRSASSTPCSRRPGRREALDDQFYFTALPQLIADGHGFIAPFSTLRRWSFAHGRAPAALLARAAAPAAVGLDWTTPSAPRGHAVRGRHRRAVTFLSAGVWPVRARGSWRRACGGPPGTGGRGRRADERDALRPAHRADVLAALRLLDSPGLDGARPRRGGRPGRAHARRGAPPRCRWCSCPRLRQPGGARAAALAAVAVVVVLAPWTCATGPFRPPRAGGHDSGTAVAGANCRETYSGSTLGGWWPGCIREHPGNEAEHHSKALSDGLRYARDHAGRLPVVLAARLGRVWSVYDPFQIPEGRSPRVQKAGTLFLLPARSARHRGRACACPDRRTLWILLAPVVVVSLTALSDLRQRALPRARRDLGRAARCGGHRRAVAAPVSRRFAVALGAIVAAGVAVRVAHTLLVAPWPPGFFNDEAYYKAVAESWRAARGSCGPGSSSARASRSPPPSGRRSIRWRSPDL